MKNTNTQKNRRGSNQYEIKRNDNEWKKTILIGLIVIIVLAVLFRLIKVYIFPDMISPIPTVHAQDTVQKENVKVITPTITPKVTTTPTTATKKDSELVEVVAYIAKVFEPEGKHVVVQAINCFYSESGLRPNAVGQNSDTHRSRDYGVAQLNDYWHKLSEAEKTEYKANIDKAYKIYKGRGNNFDAWYGKRCK